MDPDALAALFAQLGIAPPGGDVLGANASFEPGDSMDGGMPDDPWNPTGRPGQMSPTGVPTSPMPPTLPAPPPPVAPPPMPSVDPTMGANAGMPMEGGVGPQGVLPPSGIGDALYTGASNLVRSGQDAIIRDMPNSIRTGFGLPTDQLPSIDPGFDPGPRDRLPDADPGFDPRTINQMPSIGSALTPPPPNTAPMSLAPPSPGRGGGGKGGGAKAAMAAGKNPLLDMLKAIPKPAPIDVVKPTTPHAPVPARAGIQGGQLMALFDAINQGQGSGLKLPPTLLAALGGGR